MWGGLRPQKYVFHTSYLSWREGRRGAAGPWRRRGSVRAVRTGPPGRPRGRAGATGGLSRQSTVVHEPIRGPPGLPRRSAHAPIIRVLGTQKRGPCCHFRHGFGGAFPEDWTPFWWPGAPLALRAPSPGGRARNAGEGEAGHRQPGRRLSVHSRLRDKERGTVSPTGAQASVCPTAPQTRGPAGRLPSLVAVGPQGAS